MKPSEPAFPIPNQVWPNSDSQNGLTKRELFAAMAMQGMMDAYARGVVDDFGPREVSGDAVRMANALIAELEATDD